MRILGLDVGDKTIGIAVSDELGWTAQGIKTIYRKNEQYDEEQLKLIIDEYSIEKIVVGLPKNMNGSIGTRGEICQQFADYLAITFSIPVILEDERLSTVSAERMLISADVSRKKRKLVIDKMAAVIILQTYLDRKHNDKGE